MFLIMRKFIHVFMLNHVSHEPFFWIFYEHIHEPTGVHVCTSCEREQMFLKEIFFSWM